VKRFADHETQQSPALQEHENDGEKLNRNFPITDSDAETERKHGLDHAAVVVDIPWIECKCKDSDNGTTPASREQGAASSSRIEHWRETLKQSPALEFYEHVGGQTDLSKRED
jgi:hypothetical protein